MDRQELLTLTIDQWWPLLGEPFRDWLVNNMFSPLAPYTLQEIERLGGPAPDDAYWKQDTHGSRCLPAEAITWITKSADYSTISRPRQPDPRAAYFRRPWPPR